VQARLALEDGTVFYGTARGSTGMTWGEVVFNTSMTGYQEIITDPSYCGQIVVMTFPLIGNYGINPDDFESRRPFIRGFLAREICTEPSNWRSVKSLEDYLKESDILAADQFDTRALTKHLRMKGTMKGILTTELISDCNLRDEARKLSNIIQKDLVSEVTTSLPYSMGINENGDSPHVIVLDLGLKQSIARSLCNLGCRVTVVPCSFSAEMILDLEPDGLVLSNGPGDPKYCMDICKQVQLLIGKIPIMGICLGHQIVALSLGGNTFKLKYGHRGANHPVYNLNSRKVYITSQNHGYAVSDQDLPPELVVTYRNLNDGTIEGLHNPELKIITAQYHPESFPGPADSMYLFSSFYKYIKGGR